MDDKTHKKIRKIMSTVPKELTGDNIAKKERVYPEEQVGLLKKALKNKDLSEKGKKYIEGILDSPEIHKERDIVDDVKTAKLEKEVDKRIKEAIKTGALEHPDKVKDPWMERHQDRMGVSRERIRIEKEPDTCIHAGDTHLGAGPCYAEK